LPLGFLGAIGLAGLSVWAQSFRGWFLALALTLVVVGFIQLYRGRNRCRRRSPLSIAMLWVATAIVLVVLLFPQMIATLFAG
jgi:uncharacterized membrane protein YidH (DUF202 family)